MRAAAALAVFLGGCAAAEAPPVDHEPSRSQPQSITDRPFYAGYGEAIGRQPLRWTARSVARDFDRLMFQTEWGEDIPVLLKWEKPVTVALASPELARYRPFLQDLLRRITDAVPGLDISVAPSVQGEIILRTAPKDEIDEISDNVLCFVLPFNTTWRGYKALDASSANTWGVIEKLEAVTIFIPAFADPHEVRACILEEITQALGPTNDLRDLDDSIFNDDNAHAWPTSFDLLILRTLYHPALRNGANPLEASRLAHQILRAEAIGAMNRPPDPIGTRYDHALSVAERETDFVLRERAAQAAISLAKTQGAAPHRLGEAYKEAAFVAFEANDPAKVIDYLSKAELAHASALPANSMHLARVRSELAINLINLEQNETGLALIELAAPVFAANGSDWQLAHALRWRAFALSQSGKWAEASGTALEALDWARYVYGGDSKAAASWRQEFVDIGLISA